MTQQKYRERIYNGRKWVNPHRTVEEDPSDKGNQLLNER